MEFGSERDATGGQRPGALRRRAWAALTAALLLAAFIADDLSGNEVSSSLFYVVAVAVGAWFLGRGSGLITAILSTTAWVIAFHLVGRPFSKPSILYWNLAAEMCIYLTVALAVARAHAGLEKERSLSARLDQANRALERETLAVGELQRQFLPRTPPGIPGYEVEHHYATSTRAGGDYYDFFPLRDGRLGILVADASGHGAPAAVLMAMTRVLLHTTPEELFPPERVLSRLDQQLGRSLPAGWFVTACYAVLDPPSGRLEYALAGHEAPLLIRAAGGAIEQLPSRGGLPLGACLSLPFESGSITLRSGDTLIVYTDGLTEAMSPTKELFDLERLRDVLEESRSLALEGIRSRLLARLDAHMAGAPLADDLTLLMLRRDRAEVSSGSPAPADTGDLALQRL